MQCLTLLMHRLRMAKSWMGSPPPLASLTQAAAPRACTTTSQRYAVGVASGKQHFVCAKICCMYRFSMLIKGGAFCALGI